MRVEEAPAACLTHSDVCMRFFQLFFFSGDVLFRSVIFTSRGKRVKFNPLSAFLGGGGGVAKKGSGVWCVCGGGSSYARL